MWSSVENLGNIISKEDRVCPVSPACGASVPDR